MKIVPCPVCGYDAPEAHASSCPHCALEPREPTLRGAPPGMVRGIRAGLAAIPRGIGVLLTTGGTKRWLVPPFVITFGVFVALLVWAVAWVEGLVEAIRAETGELPPEYQGWLGWIAEKLMKSAVFIWIAKFSGALVVGIVFLVAMLWTFSIVYEAIAGPFLDTVHGKIERRWFGSNPRDAISRPTQILASRCALLTGIAAAIALGFVVAWWRSSGWLAWTFLVLGIPLPFLVLSVLDREYGKWLRWVIRLEGGTLWVSVKASLLAGLVLVLFFWVKFIPVIGYVLFACLAGFATAITLLDIPFSRRQWSLSQRLQFMMHHLGAMTAFGVVASLVYVVPVLGPAVLVPAASAGGLWLVCRLDKDFLRPPARRLGVRRTEPPVQIDNAGPTRPADRTG